MISDFVCETLVKRKLDTMQIAKAVGIVVGGLTLSWVVRAFGIYADHTGLMGNMLLLIGLALTVFFARHAFMLEYEYTYFSGELTIDRITAKSKRKHMIDVDAKAIEKIGRPSDKEIDSLKVGSVKDFSASKDHKDTIYIYYKDDKSGLNTLLFFTPNQKMVEAMKSSVSATVYREAFSKTGKKAQ